MVYGGMGRNQSPHSRQDPNDARKHWLKPHFGLLCATGRILGAVIPECLQTENVEHPREVVGQGHQAPLAAHFGQTPHQEMVPAGEALQRTERVLHQRTALPAVLTPVEN